jgi:hypothetical protein
MAEIIDATCDRCNGSGYRVADRGGRCRQCRGKGVQTLYMPSPGISPGLRKLLLGASFVGLTVLYYLSQVYFHH